MKSLNYTDKTHTRANEKIHDKQKLSNAESRKRYLHFDQFGFFEEW